MSQKPNAFFFAEKNNSIPGMTGSIWTRSVCVSCSLIRVADPLLAVWNTLEVQDCRGSDHVAGVFGGYKMLPGLHYST